MPPLILPAAAVVLAGLGAGWLRREWRRINAELDSAEKSELPGTAHDLKTLRRDPRTGDWRPS